MYQVECKQSILRNQYNSRCLYTESYSQPVRIIHMSEEIYAHQEMHNIWQPV